MNTKPTGGPAFPSTAPVSDTGMALRDYFAGVALAGMLNAPMGKYLHKDTAQMVADAYKIADQMLEHRVL